MMTLGEAAGENLLFMANAIAETTAMALLRRFPANAPQLATRSGYRIPRT
jgi:hypothetical protein